MLSTATKTAGEVTEASAENDLKSAAKAVGAKARNVYDSVSDDISHYADDANDRVRRLADQAKGKINDAKNQLSDRISGQPVPAAGIALGIGLVLGLLLAGAGRRRYY